MTSQIANRRARMETLECQIRSKIAYLRKYAARLQTDPECGPTPYYVVEARVYRLLLRLHKLHCVLLGRETRDAADRAAWASEALTVAQATHQATEIGIQDLKAKLDAYEANRGAETTIPGISVAA